MKLLPTPTKAVRRSSDDSLGHGMDAVITLMLFLGIGFGLDALFDTRPVFMIALTMLGAVGLFARFYYQYSARMDQHEAARVAKLAGQPSASATAAIDDGGVG